MNATSSETVGQLPAAHENRYWSIKARPALRRRAARLASVAGFGVFGILLPVIAVAGLVTARMVDRRRRVVRVSTGPTHDIAKATYREFFDVYPTAVYSPLAKSLELGCFARYPADAPSLEIGIGDGVFAAALRAHTGAHVSLGTDLIYETLASARMRAVHETVFVSDAQDIPAPAGSLSTVLMNNLMHHLPDRERVTAEVHRVLRPGGMFLFTDNLVGWNEFMWEYRLLRRILPAAWLRAYGRRKLWFLAQSLLASPAYWAECAARSDWEVVEITSLVSRTGMTVASVFEFLNLKFGQPTRPALRRLLGRGALARHLTGTMARIVDGLIDMDEQLCEDEGAAFLFVALRKRGASPVPPGPPPLACPQCKRPFEGRYSCAGCERTYPVVEGIPVLLTYADRLPWLQEYLAYQQRQSPRDFVT